MTPNQLSHREICWVTILVPNWSDGIAFFQHKLSFNLVYDSVDVNGKRWVLMQPQGGIGTCLRLVEAESAGEINRLGSQASGRVAFFLRTHDCDADYETMLGRGVTFLEQPRTEVYGKVAVFLDVCGNRWDLLELWDDRGEKLVDRQ
jgi:hypothetical protein